MAIARPAVTSRLWINVWLCLMLIILGAAISLKTGYSNISWQQIYNAFTGEVSVIVKISVFELRFPRLLLVSMCGAMLAASGALMQSVSRNNLASPGLTGVSNGAALGIVLAVTYQWLPLIYIPWLGLICGLVVGFISLSLSGIRDANPMKLVLSGAAINALCLAIIAAVLIHARADASELLYWLAGGFSGRSWSQVTMILPWFIFTVIAVTLCASQTRWLQLTDEQLSSLGYNAGRWRFLLTITAIAMVAPTVVVAGPIGFVGLVIPHLTSRLVPRSSTKWLPLCMLLGAAMLLWADTFCKLLAIKQEMPVGVVTAVLGSPLLIAYIISQGKTKRAS